MLKNNCQCDLCRSVWEGGGYMKNTELCADDEEWTALEDGCPAAKRHSAVGGGLATQVVALVLLVCGFWLLAARIPDGMWYTVPSAILLSALSAFPIADACLTILYSLEELYENN